MKMRPVDTHDPVIQSAVDELRGMIQKHFPTAQFSVYEGEDPHGIYLEAVVDIDDIDQVMDVVVDRLVDMQVEEGLPVYVSPRRTRARDEAIWREQLAERRSHP
jgi:hypothetical protein